MKKLFLLIPALVLSLTISAETKTIGPDDPNEAVNDVLIAALQTANDNDVIILTDGIYNEYSNYIDFNKNVEVKAADGAKPVVNVGCYIKVRGGKHVTVKGIKFDGTEQGHNGNSYSYFIRVYDNAANTLELEDCEFCNTDDRVILVESNKHLDLLKINNCYFHDGTNSAIFVAQASDVHACNRVEIKNSTFANYTGFSDGLVEVFTKDGATAENPDDDAEFLIDHCTFYNYIKTGDNTYGFVDVRKSTKTTISNCIFMNPSIPDGSYNAYATYTYGGTVTNCIYHGTRGNRVSPTNSSDADPLFNDLANDKYTYAGIYGVSMSPARGAGTDGSDLGDPRWYTEVTYPSTNFAAPGYYCTADNAVLSGGASASKFYLNTEADPHHIIWKETAYNDNVATWHLKATRACEITVALDLGPAYSSNKHIYEVKILDANNNPVGTLAEDPADPDGVTENNVEADQIKTFDGTIIIPAEGDYTVELRNIRGWGKGTIKNIILSYAGGAVVEIPNDDIDLADAILNTDATRDGDGIHFNGLTTASAKWNIQAEEGLYTFTAICTSTNWSNLKIEVLDTEENELFSYAPPYTYNQADKEISSPSWFLSAGNYIVRLSNPASSSNGYVKSFSATKTTDVLVIDEMANNNSAIHAANGQSKQIVLKRTFKGGMYNTLCVPFTEWSSSDLTNIFGEGYELLVMSSATLSGNELTLNFDTDTQLRHGRPYLVKPTKDVENPVFAARTIDESTGYNTKEGDAANFIGSFIAGEVPAGDQNLFLGPNDLLYFSQTATPIKGMRAYFHVKVPGAANNVKAARIVKGTQVITEINLVGANSKAIKTIENGQLIITIDGVRYNVMGTKIQ